MKKGTTYTKEETKMRNAEARWPKTTTMEHLDEMRFGTSGAISLDEADEFVEFHLKRHPLNSGNVEHIHPPGVADVPDLGNNFLVHD